MAVVAEVVSPLLFQGTLLNTLGHVIPNAKIQLWQTDHFGNYLHPDSGVSTTSNFQYFGTDSTGSDGLFDFLTYRPGRYASRPTHFHLMVWVDDATKSGENAVTQALTTQFYFTDDPLSVTVPEMLRLDVVEVDSDLYSYGSYVNCTIVIDAASSSSFTGEKYLELTPEQQLGPFYPVIDFFLMDNDLTAVDDASTTTEEPAPPTYFSTDTSSTTPPVAAHAEVGTTNSQGTTGESSSSTNTTEEEIATEPAQKESVGSQGTEVIDDKVAETVESANSSAQFRSFHMIIVTWLGIVSLSLDA